jgi:F-type H+-transporting ATPase subunit b
MKSLIAFLLLIPTLSLAAGGHGDGVPVDTIKWQVINFAIFIGLMYWILRHKVNVGELFKQRKASYKELVEKAEGAKKQAEATRKEFESKLTSLNKEAETINEKARQEALELKHKMIAEAKETSERLIKDAQSVAMYELEKAKLQLKTELVEEAFLKAEEKLQTKVSDRERDKLKTDFVNKIQVVQ